MFYGVVQGLLGDAVERLFNFEGYLWLPVERGLDPYAVACLEGGGLFFQGGDEALPLQGLRAQLEDEGAHLGHPRFCEGGGVVEGFGGAFGIVGQELAGGLDPKGDAVEG